MVEFSTLPQLLLCRILSNIPLSKRKIQLGIVNKAWHQALLLPQSHTAALPEQAIKSGTSLPTGSLLAGVQALSVVFSATSHGLVVDCASCEALHRLRLREEVIQNNRRTRIETVFAPPPAGLWLDKLQVLDLGEQPLRQTAALPVLTHLICSLPLEDVLNPDYYPALQQLIITNMFPDNGSSFARLHECRHVEVKEAIFILTWQDFPKFKMPVGYKTLAMSVTDPGLLPECFMQNCADTALPLVTHLWLFDTMGPGQESGHTLDLTAAKDHMPRLQHFIYEKEHDDWPGEESDTGGSWGVVVTPFPLTILMPTEELKNPVNAKLPALVARAPGHRKRFVPFPALAPQAGGLHAWSAAAFRNSTMVTFMAFPRPVMHLPGLDPTWCLRAGCPDLRKEPLRWCGMCGMYDSSTYLHPSKKLLRCNGCLTVGYCSQLCQKLHWKQCHKKVCSSLKGVARG